jgi:hypothetical protein
MIPDMHTGEKLALAHRQQLQREAEHEQMLGALPGHSSHWMRHMAVRLRTFLMAFGIRLIPSREQRDIPRFREMH